MLIAVGQSFSATMIRGMGLAVEYHRETGLEPRYRPSILSSIYVPTIEVDKLAYGIIPGNPSLGTWDIPTRAQWDADTPCLELIKNALSDLRIIGSHIGEDALDSIRDSEEHWNSGNQWPAFTDLLCLWMDWMPTPGSPITKVYSPFCTRIFTMGEVYEARVVWRWLLQQMEERDQLSVIMKRVLDHFNTWASKYEERFFEYHTDLQDNRLEEMEFVAHFKPIFDETTSCFEAMALKYRVGPTVGGTKSAPSPSYSSTKALSFYAHLVASHIKVNAHSLKEADKQIDGGNGRNDGRVGVELWDAVFAERAFVYVDNVPKVIEEMQARGFVGKTAARDIEDAWWMLMLRAQVFECGAGRDEYSKIHVPSSYYGSPTKVHLL